MHRSDFSWEGRRLLKVVVCVRRVPDTAARIKITSDGKSIDTSDAEFVINPYEEYAVAHREVEGGSITVETTFPAAFTAEKDLTTPRYASLRELVAARKKPIVVRDVQLPMSSIEIVSIQNPPPRSPGKIVGKGVEAVPTLVKLLHEEAKVI